MMCKRTGCRGCDPGASPRRRTPSLKGEERVCGRAGGREGGSGMTRGEGERVARGGGGAGVCWHLTVENAHNYGVRECVTYRRGGLESLR
jgi:hypothetical protein